MINAAAASRGSAEVPDRVFAAAVGGLWVSENSGGAWTSVLETAPVSSIEVMSDGTLLAFVRGRGLVRTAEDKLSFEAVGPNDWGDLLLFHLTVDPADPQRLFAATQHGTILGSDDAGQSWSKLGQ